MNILLVTEFFPNSDNFVATGGVEVRTYYLYRELIKTHKVEVISRGSGQITANFWSVFPRLWFMIKAVLMARKLEFDLVEGSNWLTHVAAFVIGKIHKKPTVAWFADVYRKTWFEFFPVMTAALGYLLESMALLLPWDGVIAMSEVTKKKLVANGVDSGKIEVVYGGVEVKKLAKLKAETYKQPTVVAVSRLVNYKKIEVLIQAFDLVVKKIPMAKLIIVGEGPEAVNLKTMVDGLGLSNTVEFWGALSHEQTVKTIKRAWLLSLPSVVEGFGLVTVEAMAVGTPYVNSDIDTNVEVTNHGKGGLLFDKNNSKDLAAKIIRLLTNKRLYRTKILEGKKLAKRYDWGEIAKQTEAIYKKALESKAI